MELVAPRYCTVFRPDGTGGAFGRILKRTTGSLERVSLTPKCSRTSTVRRSRLQIRWTSWRGIGFGATASPGFILAIEISMYPPSPAEKKLGDTFMRDWRGLWDEGGRL